MSLSRSPSSTTFTKETKKIGCFSALRPIANAIRSILPGTQRIPLHSPPTFYIPLPSPVASTPRPAAPAAVAADIFSRPASPIALLRSPSIASELSFGWIDDISYSDADEESLFSVDLASINLDTSDMSDNEIRPSNLIIYRVPEPAQIPMLPIQIRDAAAA